MFFVHLQEIEQMLFCKYKAWPHWGKCTNRMFYPPCPVKDTLPMFEAFLNEQGELSFVLTV